MSIFKSVTLYCPNSAGPLEVALKFVEESKVSKSGKLSLILKKGEKVIFKSHFDNYMKDIKKLNVFEIVEGYVSVLKVEQHFLVKV